MRTLLLILLLVVGLPVLAFLSALLLAAFWLWRASRGGPTWTMRCPRCGGTDFSIATSGLWDGFPDPKTGVRAHGISMCGTCNQCGSRVGQAEADAPFLLSDEEWRREVEEYCR